MEIPDVLVVTKSDLGAVAQRALADLRAALRSLGAESVPVVAVSSMSPPTGIEELVDALDRRHQALDLAVHRLRGRRAAALAQFAVEHGELGLQALGGRRAAWAWLEAQPPGIDAPALVAGLASRARHARGPAR
jgi:LAO/AO transport system kinase